jgi:hypothetical protein
MSNYKLLRIDQEGLRSRQMYTFPKYLLALQLKII